MMVYAIGPVICRDALTAAQLPSRLLTPGVGLYSALAAEYVITGESGLATRSAWRAVAYDRELIWRKHMGVSDDAQA